MGKPNSNNKREHKVCNTKGMCKECSLTKVQMQFYNNVALSFLCLLYMEKQIKEHKNELKFFMTKINKKNDWLIFFKYKKIWYMKVRTIAITLTINMNLWRVSCSLFSYLSYKEYSYEHQDESSKGVCKKTL